jgi:hypothetical protein
MFHDGKDNRELIETGFSESVIARKYLKLNRFPSVMLSPLRRERKPSFGVFLDEDEKVRCHDFGTGCSYTLPEVLMKVYDVNMSQLIEMIKAGREELMKEKEESFKPVRKREEHVKLEIKTRKLLPRDVNYWDTYGITPEFLKFSRTYPVSHFFVNDVVHVADSFAYAYVEFKDGITGIKIYQPFSETRKWLTNRDGSTWDLWEQVMNSDQTEHCIIASSKKDAMTLWCNLGIPSTSLQGEGYNPKPHVVNQLKEKFKHVYVFFDNDNGKSENHGRRFAKKLSKVHGIKMIEIGDVYTCKDPSDFIMKYGKEKLKELVNEQLE